MRRKRAVTQSNHCFQHTTAPPGAVCTCHDTAQRITQLPDCNLTEGQPLWSWYAVGAWLSKHDMIRPETLRDTEIVAAINTALDRSHQIERDAALVDEVSRAVAST
jgi:hypothetical protein